MKERMNVLRQEIAAALDKFEGAERHEAADETVAPSFDTSIYRPDGFSIQMTENGARSFYLVDEAIQALRDAGFDDVANDQDQFFTFGPNDGDGLWPDDPELAERAQYSFDQSWGESQWIAESRGQPVKRAFKLKRDPQMPIFNLYFRKIDGTATIFLPTGWTPVQAVTDIANNLRRYIAENTTKA